MLTSYKVASRHAIYQSCMHSKDAAKEQGSPCQLHPIFEIRHRITVFTVLHLFTVFTDMLKVYRNYTKRQFGKQNSSYTVTG